MKVLIHSNAPTVYTGYGVQCALLARRLRDDGHDVAISCTYGLQGTARLWEDIQLYPCGWETQGNDIIHNHAMRHFDGDPLGGWVIVLNDLWAITNPLLEEFNVIGWCPVDHFPTPPRVLEFFSRSGAEAAAMSRFGELQLRDAGLDPAYLPLAVDTSIYKPTETVEIVGEQVTGREMLDLPADAFVVGMNAMNKDHGDRKGFNEAFRAFGVFHHEHPDSVLYVHSDPNGMGSGLNLRELAAHSNIPPHAIKFPAIYDLQTSAFTPPMMAAAYTAMDVLLAPSHGEGFCVPLIEAQACGTPVIVTDFSAQAELVGAGWKVAGQPLWDHAQRASYVIPHIHRVYEALKSAHEADLPSMAEGAIAFASQYDADTVYGQHWRPLLTSLEPAEPLELDRDADGLAHVDIVVPVMCRPHNVRPLVESLREAGDEGWSLHFVCDPDDMDQIAAVKEMGLDPLISDRGHTFAQKANYGFEHTDNGWIFLCGDDVRFREGWINNAAKLSDRFDVIGTNDAPDGNGNPKVQSGKHADHFFVRRAYVDVHGASLDGPGVVCHEGYNHFYVDSELIDLARARGVFSPCLESVVEHLHPGLGKGQPDMVYRSIRDPESLEDKETFDSRRPLIQMQTRGRGKR